MEGQVQEEQGKWTTPRRQLFKQEDSFVKMEYLQDTGEPSPGREPTEKELCECIIMIKERFADCRLDRIIQMLNDELLRNQQEARRERAKAIRLLQEEDYLSEDEQNITEGEKKRIQLEYARRFENSEANPRFYEQREIAKLFCLKGYGYPTAREYLGDNITPNRYNNVITTIVRLSYRKLQYFVSKHIKSNLVGISREELKMIKTPLVNCRIWMTERQAENFHRFVKLTYKIHTEEPEKEVAMELLQAIMEELKKRNVTYRHHRRGEEHAGWTELMEQHLIFHYLNNATAQEIQRQLMLQHPASRSAFEIGRLKIMIDRLIRYSIKRANVDREKFGIVEFIPISDYFTNRIIRSDNADEARKRLLTYYLDHDRTAPKVREVFNAVKEFIAHSKEEVEEIEDSHGEVAPKQEMKAEEHQPASIPNVLPDVAGDEAGENPKEQDCNKSGKCEENARE